MTAALLAAGAALCYGVSNFVGPRLVRDLPLYPVLISGQVVALVVSAALLATESGTPTTAQVAAASLAGLGNAFALIAFYRAAELGPMSIVAPLGALGAVVPVLAGRGAGREHRRGQARRDRARAGRRRAGGAAERAGAGRRCRRPARGGGLGAAVLARLRHLPRRDVGGRRRRRVLGDRLSRVSLLALYVVVAVRLSSPLRVAARDVPRVMVPGLLLFAGTLLYTVATREGDLSVVSVIASLAPVVIVALAFTAARRAAQPHAGARAPSPRWRARSCWRRGSFRVVGLAQVPAALRALLGRDRRRHLALRTDLLLRLVVAAEA